MSHFRARGIPLEGIVIAAMGRGDASLTRIEALLETE